MERIKHVCRRVLMAILLLKVQQENAKQFNVMQQSILIVRIYNFSVRVQLVRIHLGFSLFYFFKGIY